MIQAWRYGFLQTFYELAGCIQLARSRPLATGYTEGINVKLFFLRFNRSI